MYTDVEFSERIFEKCSISNFMKIRPVGSRVAQCGRKIGHKKGNSRFSQFCERPQKWVPASQKTARLHYKDKLVNAVCGNDWYELYESHTVRQNAQFGRRAVNTGP